jgi:hypothetical protein
VDHYVRHGSLHGTVKELEKMSVKIWHVLEGPITRNECLDSYDWPDDAEYSMLCKAEDDEGMFEADFYFEVYEDAFEWKTYFKTNIDPLIINSDANDA